MNRPWQVWSAFAACSTLVAIALGWLTYRAVALDRAEALGRQQAALEENARLALWRMDSAMAALVAQESARPYFAYQPFFPVQLPTNSKVGPKEGSTPSPLLTEATPLVKLHFQVDPSGVITSPRVPTGRYRPLAIPQFLSTQQLAEGEQLLGEIRKIVRPNDLLALLPDVSGGPTLPTPAPNDLLKRDNRFGMEQQVDAAPEVQSAQQRARNTEEFQARSILFQSGMNRAQQLYTNDEANLTSPLVAATSPADGKTAVMTPLWFDGELLLARKVTIDGRPCVQGCWLDLPAIRKQLLDSVENILPAAQLRAVTEDEPSHKLASLPLEVVPGPAPTLIYTSMTSMELALLMSWAAFGIAAIAVALVLLGVVSLSERRAAFVSAVTHELRTPLTTFRLYAEMLAEGMVPDEAARGKYLSTLRSEADRLMHLVENVLAYARLERGRMDKRTTPICVRELIDRSLSRLTARAEQAGLSLVVKEDGTAMSAKALADPTAVEQVLFNLVDNASKYATGTDDHRLILEASQEDGWVTLSLHDHGKGIEHAERRRLFRPFHKSAADAALSAPGVGLGLALSRRLARAMGGDLKLDDTPDGASFSLVLKAC